MQPIAEIRTTRHAEHRIGQRGVTRSFLEALLANADRETEVGGGATALRVSRDRARQLNVDDRLHHYAAVLAADGALVTVLPVQAGRRGRRYRSN